MALANLMFFLANSTYILFPIFLKNLGASESYIGIMNNIDKIFVIITSIGIATFIRVRNKIPLLRIGYFIFLITCSSYLLIKDLSWYIPLIRIFHGIGFSIAMIMGSTIIFDLVPLEDAAEAIGIYGVTGAITNAVSPFAGEMLLSMGYSFYHIFVTTVVLIFLSLCISFIMPRSQYCTEFSQKAQKGFLFIFGNPQFLIIIITSIIFGGGFGVIVTYLPNFILSTTTYKFSYFFITYIAILILIRFRVIRLLNSFKKNYLLGTIFLLSSLMYVSLNFLYSIVILFLVGIMYGIVHGILYPVLNSTTIGLVPEQERSTANALFTGCFHGGMMLSFLLGFVIDYTGTYLSAFNIYAAVSLLAVLLIVFNAIKYGPIVLNIKTK